MSWCPRLGIFDLSCEDLKRQVSRPRLDIWAVCSRQVTCKSPQTPVSMIVRLFLALRPRIGTCISTHMLKPCIGAAQSRPVCLHISHCSWITACVRLFLLVDHITRGRGLSYLRSRRFPFFILSNNPFACITCQQSLVNVTKKIHCRRSGCQRMRPSDFSIYHSRFDL